MYGLREREAAAEVENAALRAELARNRLALDAAARSCERLMTELRAAKAQGTPAAQQRSQSPTRGAVFTPSTQPESPRRARSPVRLAVLPRSMLVAAAAGQ